MTTSRTPVAAQYLLPKLGMRIHHTRMDCSHFVNYLFKKAHLPYKYANSQQLYRGVGSFERVFDPRPGDLIVWRGHVGIVVDPNESKFVSVLRSGVKTDDYHSPYWRRRGKPRFLRYVATPGTGTLALQNRGDANPGGD